MCNAKGREWLSEASDSGSSVQSYPSRIFFAQCALKFICVSNIMAGPLLSEEAQAACIISFSCSLCLLWVQFTSHHMCDPRNKLILLYVRRAAKKLDVKWALCNISHSHLQNKHHATQTPWVLRMHAASGSVHSPSCSCWRRTRGI